MINFGMPRVGNGAFAALFGAAGVAGVRAVHRRDIVPHLPLRAYPRTDYHHVATEVWFAAGGWRVCDGSGEDPACADSLEPWQWRPADHNVYLGVRNNNCGGP